MLNIIAKLFHRRFSLHYNCAPYVEIIAAMINFVKKNKVDSRLKKLLTKEGDIVAIKILGWLSIRAKIRHGEYLPAGEEVDIVFTNNGWVWQRVLKEFVECTKEMSELFIVVNGQLDFHPDLSDDKRQVIEDYVFENYHLAFFID